MTRRNKLEILSCILNLCKTDGSSKTRIVYQVNLNFKNAGLYLDWLVQRKYLEKEGRLYRITPIGRDLLNNLNDINSTINGHLDDVVSGED